jgi:hypothetical protein
MEWTVDRPCRTRDRVMRPLAGAHGPEGGRQIRGAETVTEPVKMRGDALGDGR